MSLLDGYDFPIEDKEFLNLLNCQLYENERKFLEKLWLKYEQFADKLFEAELGRHFHQRYWEMYLACALLDHDFNLQPKKTDEGPDIHILEKNSNIWIEAIAPNAGKGLDAVPRQILGKCNAIPHDKIILRYRSSIKEKHEKYSIYLRDGIVASVDPYIIAINGRDIPFSELEKEVPNIISAVLPIGDKWIKYNPNDLKIISRGYEFYPEIIKSEGAPVSTCVFNDPCFSGISGILFSNSNLYNRPEISGTEFIYIHNPMAINKLPFGWLKFGLEYWEESGELQSRNVE